jgi:nitrogen-specific signal transduction histidine kinase
VVSLLLIKESRLDPLLSSVCQALKNSRLYKDVSMGVLNNTLRLETASGTGQAPLPANELFAIKPTPGCIQAVINQKEPLVLTEDSDLCAACPLSKGCHRWASILMPLSFKGTLHAILFVTIPTEVVSVNTEVKFLAEIGENIAAGLHRVSQEKLHRKTATALIKRSLELNYFHSFSRIIEQQELGLETILQKAIDLIPASMQHSSLAAAELFLAPTGQRFCTPNFRESSPRLKNRILVDKDDVGVLTVCYLPQPDKVAPLAFLDEERDLVRSISVRIGKVIERKQGRIALEESEQRFRDLTNNAVTGIAILQAKRIVFQNPEYRNIFGSLSDSSTLFCDPMIHTDDVEKTRQFYTAISRKGFTTLSVDFRICARSPREKNETIKSVFCRAAMTEFQGKPAVLLNVMDMTKPRELEHLLGIQDKMTSLGRITAGIAHEIRNPLSGINIYLKSLEKYNATRENDTEKKIITKMQSASDRIESVIKRVIDFSKPGDLKPTLLDINIPVQNAIDLAAVTLRKSGVRLETSLSDLLPRCNADSHMIEQVMLNLMTNASEAMKALPPDAKAIAIKTEPGDGTEPTDGKAVTIRVEDSGPGISEFHRERIFDPFYTTKNSSGIGLSICQRIINDHKGKLEVYQSRLGGAGFVIHIPV